MNETSNVPAVVQRALEEQKVKLGDCNLMLPTQTFGEVLGMFDRVTVEVVTIDANPEKGDVFPVDGKRNGSDKLALGKVPLQKISNALGIVWDPQTTTVLESSDTKSRAKATGAMRKPNGEYIVVSEEKTVDLGAIEEEQRMKIEEDAEKGKIVGWEENERGKSFPKFAPWKDEKEKRASIELSIRKALLPYRKFKDERAMTGAKERVIRAFLGIKSTYSRAELAKPFAFPRVTTDAAKMLATPETRAAAVEHLSAGVASVFGHRAREERPAIELADEPVDVQARRIDPDTGEITEPAAAETFEDDLPWTEEKPKDAKPESTPLSAAQDALRAYLDQALPKNAVEEVRAVLNDKAATLEQVNKMVDRCSAYVQARGEKRAARKAGAA